MLASESTSVGPVFQAGLSFHEHAKSDTLNLCGSNVLERIMKSPVADTPLITVELDEIEIDLCPVSGGIWLDQGELELLFDDPHAAAALLAEAEPVTGAGNRKLACPVSGQEMAARRLGKEPPVVVDISPHGIWFDKGELDTILMSAGATERVEHLRAFLHGFFRHEQKEQANHAE